MGSLAVHVVMETSRPVYARQSEHPPVVRACLGESSHSYRVHESCLRYMNGAWQGRPGGLQEKHPRESEIAVGYASNARTGQ